MFLYLACQLVFRSLVVSLHTDWSFLLVVSISLEVSLLMPHWIDLSCLWVSSDLFDMTHSGFGTLKLLHKLPHSTSRKLNKSMLPSVIVPDTKSSSCKKNQKISQCNIFALLGDTLQDLLVPGQHCTIH